MIELSISIYFLFRFLNFAYLSTVNKKFSSVVTTTPIL